MTSSTAAEEIQEHEPLLSGNDGDNNDDGNNRLKKGGLTTLPFIIANEALESCASNGFASNLTGYLMGQYGMSAVGISNLLYLWSTLNGFNPVVGAFLADAYVGRYWTIAIGSIFSCLGMSILWLTAAIPEARPCSDKLRADNCKSPTSLQVFVLYCCFVVMAIGAGGIRSSSLAFGGDQLTNKKHRKIEGLLESFISWYYASTLVGSLFGITVIVYVQDNFGWNLGFGIPAALMLLSMLSFFFASPFYVKHNPSSSFFTSLFQVVVASLRKRHVPLPYKPSCNAYHLGASPTDQQLAPSDKLRFLNKACIIANSEEETLSNPWSVCTVEQVENLKSIINIVPIWSAGILFSIAFNQTTLPYIQVSSMDRHITPNFQIPTGSFSMFTFISIGLWIVLYDRILVPVASKITRKPTRMKPLYKIGFGILMTTISWALLGVIEIKRRVIVIEEEATMSARWLLPHYMFGEIGDACCVIGQNEFFYLELPKSMSSIATSIIGLSMSAGAVAAGFMMTGVDNLSKGGGGESWVSSNINKAHYDYYYFLISIISYLDLLYFVVCCKRYRPCKREEEEPNSKISEH